LQIVDSKEGRCRPSTNLPRQGGREYSIFAPSSANQMNVSEPFDPGIRFHSGKRGRLEDQLRDGVQREEKQTGYFEQ
jgi:hypothetical protein